MSSTFDTIMSGVPIVGSFYNAISQGVQNKKNRKWQEKMYGVQRRDSLADWNMQNEYNSPANQMKLYKEAGLNPNLIYGSGTVAQADQPRQSSPGNWKGEAPQLDAMSWAQAEQMKQTVNIQKQQQEILVEEKRGKGLDNDLKELNLEVERNSLGYTMDVRKWSADNIEQQNRIFRQNITQNDINIEQSKTDNLLNNTRKGIDNAIQNLQLKYFDKDKSYGYRAQDDTHKKAKYEIQNLEKAGRQIEATIKGTQAGTTATDVKRQMDEIELAFNKKGLSLKDPAYIRILNIAIPHIMKQISAGKSFADALKEGLKYALE